MVEVKTNALHGNVDAPIVPKKRKTKKVLDSFLRDIGMPEVPIAL